MRILFFFPFDILNYAAGLTRIRYKDFIVGSLVGLIFEIFSLSFFGDSLNNPRKINIIVSLSLIFVMLVVSTFMYKNKIKDRLYDC